eukprot:TRINITY_DN7860_c0_g1_i1.p1 TRINITY_DN7860_c0_g1~~TRINITY_DN7860_c0_g1_i1.p1  ORF type:complete len:187 (+),score=45.37 TRINITY_DN7860_c0_g1_i1:106-666(+)
MATQTITQSAFSSFNYSQSPRYSNGYRQSELIAPKPVCLPPKNPTNFLDPMFEQATEEIYGILFQYSNDYEPEQYSPPSFSPSIYNRAYNTNPVITCSSNSAFSAPIPSTTSSSTSSLQSPTFEKVMFQTQPMNIVGSSGGRNLHDMLVGCSSQSNSYSESYDYMTINNTPPTRAQNPVTLNSQFV